MQVLLISTYDLGRQPFGLASPAAWLRTAGIDVTCVDASRDPLQDDQIGAASLVAFYLPMHTATRLTAPLITRVRALNPSARLCAYGLYAPLNDAWLREQGVHDVLGPEAEGDLLALANSIRSAGAHRQLPVRFAGFNFQRRGDCASAVRPAGSDRPAAAGSVRRAADA